MATASPATMLEWVTFNLPTLNPSARGTAPVCNAHHRAPFPVVVSFETELQGSWPKCVDKPLDTHVVRA